MPVVGTAGHVDHGKSTLVERLTGRDPDRWEEEKRRGLTIDLGFSWASLPGGVEVSFVDVPGHEKFSKNMLAGVEAIDVALLVVAADEGWMPQTEEHLAVLDLLAIDKGVIAMTKVDLVDTDIAGLVRDEIEENLSGSSLEGSPVVPVSAVDGTGIDELAAELARLSSGEPRSAGRPRLWVDRSFSAPGAGTVVTGTLLDGTLVTGSEVEIYPRGVRGRIRGLQSHEKAATQLLPGRRAAVNLAGVDRSSVGRGDMLGLPGEWETSSRFSAFLRLARYVDQIPRKASLHLHLGSGAQPVRLAGIEGDVAVLEMGRGLPMTSGDRFILRDVGRKMVIAGGRVLDPAPGKLGSALSHGRDLDPGEGIDGIATALLRIRGEERARIIANHSGGGTPRDGQLVGEVWVTSTRLEELSNRALQLVAEEHQQHPLREGLPMATLSERLGVEAALTEAAVDAHPRLARRGAFAVEESHEVAMTPQQIEAWAEAREKIGRGLDVPRLDDLGIDDELVHLLFRRGELVRIAEDLALLPSQVEQVKEVIAAMPEGFKVAEFRDRAGLSRKYAVPLLEWADKEGLTIRRGDTRTAR